MKITRIDTKLIFALCIFLLSIIYLFAAKGLVLGVMKRPGVGFLPVISGILLAVFSLIEIIKISVNTNDVSKVNIKWKKVCFFLSGVVVYTLVLKLIGYTIASFALLLFLTKLFGVKSWIKPVIFAAVLSFGSYYLFVQILFVQLP